MTDGSPRSLAGADVAADTTLATNAHAGPRAIGRRVNAAGWLRAAGQALDLNALSIVRKLTLLLIVVYGPKFWSTSVPSVMCAAVGCCWETLSSSRWFWCVLSLPLSIAVMQRVYAIDNHKVLMVYWCWSVAICVKDSVALRECARTIMALVFLAAAFWKWSNAEFVRNDVMHFLLATDDRFAPIAVLCCGMTRGAYNDALIESIRVGTTDSVELASGALSLLVATLMTWWTLAIESLAALAFLVRSGPLDRWRNAILVVFVSTTYPFAPVLGFGWLLCIMGFAQCRNDEPAWRSVYIALLVGMQLFQIPWFDMLAS